MQTFDIHIGESFLYNLTDKSPTYEFATLDISVAAPPYNTIEDEEGTPHVVIVDL